MIHFYWLGLFVAILAELNKIYRIGDKIMAIEKILKPQRRINSLRGRQLTPERI